MWPSSFVAHVRGVWDPSFAAADERLALCSTTGEGRGARDLTYVAFVERDFGPGWKLMSSLVVVQVELRRVHHCESGEARRVNRRSVRRVF